MHRKRMAGVTLVELLVTIAIVAVLAAIAFPSFEGTLRANRVATLSNELLGSVSLARSEAIRSTKSAIICASSNGTSCGTDWNQGWIVWVDENGNGAMDAGETVVRNVQAHANMALSIAAAGGPSASVVTFDSRGRPDNVAGTRKFILQPSTCPAGQTLRRELTLNGVGQVKMESKACA